MASRPCGSAARSVRQSGPSEPSIARIRIGSCRLLGGHELSSRGGGWKSRCGRLGSARSRLEATGREGLRAGALCQAHDHGEIRPERPNLDLVHEAADIAVLQAVAEGGVEPFLGTISWLSR